MNLLLALATVVTLAAASPTAAPPTSGAAKRPYALMAGDPAPALSVSSWVQGEPVTAFEPGTIYVIDFWATWCGPCKQAMPELTAMQKELGDRVVFIGLDSWDYADRVAPFVMEMGDRLGYRVAIDRSPPPPPGETNVPMFVKANGDCSKAWMVASGLASEGIPTLFVVDQRGRLAWIGNDTAELKATLTRMLDGGWDLDGYAARYAKDAVILKQGRALQGRIFERRQQKDWRAAIADVQQLMAVDARYAGYAGLAFKLTYVNLRDRAGALAFADAQVKGNPSPAALEEIAAVIAANDSATTVERAAAERFARQSIRLGEDRHPGPYRVLGLLARRRGDKAAAIRFQSRAVELTTDPDERTEAETTLRAYRE